MKKIAGIGKTSRKNLSKVIREAKGGFVTCHTVTQALKISPQKARAHITLWIKSGWLQKIRKGLYLPLDVAAIPGNQTEDPWIIANEIFSPCYIGGFSAANYWDFTEQIFESTIVISSRHFNKKNQTISNLRFLLKSFTNRKIFGLKTVWQNQFKIQISDPHKTIIDILDDPSLGGGIRTTIDILRAYLSSSHFSESELSIYAKKMKNKTIFKRLGFLISEINPNLSDIINFCHLNISKGYSQLDPQVKGARLIKKWNLWIPKGLFND